MQHSSGTRAGSDAHLIMSFADVPLGSELQLNTPQGVIAGSVFAYDKPSGILVLKETGSHSGVSNLRVLRTDNNVSIISFEKPAAPMSTVLPAVDMERARRREEKAMQQAEMEASRVGVGVSKEAQVCEPERNVLDLHMACLQQELLKHMSPCIGTF